MNRKLVALLALALTWFFPSHLRAASTVVDLWSKPQSAVVFDTMTLRQSVRGITLANHVNVTQSATLGSGAPVTSSQYILAAQTLSGNGNWLNVEKGSILTNTPTAFNANYNSGGNYNSGQTAWDDYMTALGMGEFDDIHSSLTVYSTQLAGMAQTGTYNGSDPNRVLFTGDGSSLTVINITGAQLALARGIEVQLAAGQVMIVNVSGEVASSTANFLNNQRNVIWNFHEALNVMFDTTVQGSVLAPLANLNLNNGGHGLMVANNLNSGGQLSFHTIDSLPSLLAVPEPAPLLSLAGLIATGLFLRTRRCN